MAARRVGPMVATRAVQWADWTAFPRVVLTVERLVATKAA